MPKAKKGRGRPPKLFPPPKGTTPEDIAKAMLRLPRDYKWKYLEKEAKEGSK